MVRAILAAQLVFLACPVCLAQVNASSGSNGSITTNSSNSSRASNQGNSSAFSALANATNASVIRSNVSVGADLAAAGGAAPPITDLAVSPVPQFQNCILFTANMSTADVELGLYVASTAPSTIQVEGVDGGRWAWWNNISVGDYLVTVNGASISRTDFIQMSSSVRPLSLVFARCPAANDVTVELLATIADTHLGFLATMPPGPVNVTTVEAGMWADRANIVAGDLLISVNGLNASLLQPEQLMRYLQVVRPLSLVFLKGIAPPSTTLMPSYRTFRLTAQASDSQLGFRPSITDTITLASVETGSWADRSGLRAGDELLSVNGVQVFALSTAGLLKTLQTTRPLTMVFGRRSGGAAAGGQSSSTKKPAPPPAPPPPTKQPEQSGDGEAKIDAARPRGHCWFTALLVLLLASAPSAGQP